MNFGLPRQCFASSELFQRELGEIFSRSWICAGPVPAQPEFDTSAAWYYLHNIGQQSVIVTNNARDGVKAWHNVCRHRGTRLLNNECGSLKNNCITCPYHAWTYNTGGELIGAPNMLDEPGFERNKFGLFPIRSATWGGYVFLATDDRAGSFEEFISPVEHRLRNWNLSELRLATSRTYDVNANWKLLFQNYSECYHCPTVHPALNQVTPYKGASNDLLSGPILGGPMELADGFLSVTRTGAAIAEPFSNLDAVQRRHIYYYTVFPNWFISAHPDYVMIHRLLPVNRNRTTVVCEFLVAAGTDDLAVQPAAEMWDEVNRQDWGVCELTQKGVESRAYQPGPYSNLESMLVAWDRHYRSVFEI